VFFFDAVVNVPEKWKNYGKTAEGPAEKSGTTGESCV